MSFNQKSGYYNSTDSIKLYYTLFTPKDADAKATVIILHGMQEHSGRYIELATYFVNSGFAVLTYDHVGHNKSVNNPKDLGYFTKDNPAEKLIADAGIMSDFLEKEFPKVPHFILGHSMGSFITRCLLQRRSNKFSGAIIVGTGGSEFGMGILKTYFSIANFLAPKSNTFFNTIFGKMNNSHFKKDKDFSDTSWLSLSKENRQNFVNDSLCGIPFTNNAFYALFSVYQQATKSNWANSISKSFPFLFVSGQDDPIGNFGKGVIKTVKGLKDNGFVDVESTIYPEMRHEILLEDIREEVINSIIDWINNKL